MSNFLFVLYIKLHIQFRTKEVDNSAYQFQNGSLRVKKMRQITRDAIEKLITSLSQNDYGTS